MLWIKTSQVHLSFHLSFRMAAYQLHLDPRLMTWWQKEWRQRRQLESLEWEPILRRIAQTDMKNILPVRTEIFWAIIRPPSTPIPVQIAWPITPPVITPHRFSRADKMIVVIWERSPHSATNVIVKACTNILNKTLKAPAFAFLAPPASGSTVILFASLFT